MVGGKDAAKGANTTGQTDAHSRAKVGPEKKKVSSAAHATTATNSVHNTSHKTTTGQSAAHGKRKGDPKSVVGNAKKKEPEKPTVERKPKDKVNTTTTTNNNNNDNNNTSIDGGTVSSACKDDNIVPVVEDLEQSDVSASMMSSCVKAPTRTRALHPQRRESSSTDGDRTKALPTESTRTSASASCITDHPRRLMETNGRKGNITVTSVTDIDPGPALGTGKRISGIGVGVGSSKWLARKNREDDEEEEDDNDDDDNNDNDNDDDDDDDDDEEEDEEGDDDEEEDDEEDDDEDDEEEDDEEEDGDAGGSSTKEGKRIEEQITVKISREGDKNVKVMYVTRQTKFKAFSKDVMRRFSYFRLRDFDMYCIDATGDHVDIDVPRDFKNLISDFLQSLKRERERMEETKSRLSPPATAKVSCRFSARGTVLGGASLSRPGSHAGEVATPLVEDAERSSISVLRLFVRDSYKKRRKEEIRHMSVTLTQGQASGLSLMSPKSSSARPLVGSVVESALDVGSPGSVDFLSGGCSNLSAQFSNTARQLAQTIGFREGEEVQWSRMGLLGKGSFGSVYEGITSEGKIMAVKVMEIPLDEDAAEVTGIQREINLMRSLKHKNIVAYYGCQTKELSNGARQLEIFLEHCHGGSLSHLRRKFERVKERFSISLVRTYTKQILEGLAYLHSMNVVHRDLKSDNVLISALGEAKLADFGCSKRLGTATMQQDTCGEKGAGYQTMVGTPLFMAPEVLNCESAYSKPADVWSVGCLILEMLGRQPWALKNNANAFQIMYHISKSTSMPTGVPKKCPAGLYSFFTRCFEREPGKRGTADELLTHEWITCPDSQLQEVLEEVPEV